MNKKFKNISRIVVCFLLAIVLAFGNYTYACDNLLGLGKTLSETLRDEIINKNIINENAICDHSIVDGIVDIDPTNLIDTLSINNLNTNEYLKREPELESDLHTRIYKCADGNNVAYIFQNPIKYIDENGNTKDIDTSIRISDSRIKDENCLMHSNDLYWLSSENNNIKVFYSEKLCDKKATVVAKYNNWSVSLSPFTDLKTDTSVHEVKLCYDNEMLGLEEALSEEAYDEIQYSNALEKDVHLVYNTTFTGYKEKIIINDQIEKNVFNFELETNGLTPCLREGGEIVLINPETEEEVASFAPLFVYDSSTETKTTIDNRYTITRIDGKNDSYVVSLVIDETFLNDKNTVFPVIVDPTFSFKTTSAIDDAPVYSGKPTTNYGNNYYNILGYADDAYKIGSLLVKFPALKNSTFFNELGNTRINSVTFNVYKVGGNTSYTSNLSAYNYTGSNWNENSVTYNSAAINSNTGAYVSSVNMKNNQLYQFDITNAAKSWKNGNNNYDQGIVIKNTTNNSNSTYKRDLASVEYGSSVNSNYMPYITVVFSAGGSSSEFTSADLAAKHFAQSVYKSSEYTRIEYAAVIYVHYGKYYYQNVHYGEPHSVSVSCTVPSGATYIGYVHTHPNSEYFSDADINFAEAHGGYAYVVTPLYKLKKYDSSTNVTSTIYTSMTIYSLTAAEKNNLVSELEPIWNAHIASGPCDFNCNTKTWPNDI